MNFKDFKLNDQIMKNIQECNYVNPTRIQVEAIPIVMNKENLLGLAQTGTGKTAAFLLPLIHNFVQDNKKGNKKPKVLIIAPTRDLINQLYDNFKKYSKGLKINGICLYGGCGYKHQLDRINSGVDFIFANTGRLMDLVFRKKILDLSEIDTLILDEADQMLDMGFIPDIEKICKKLTHQKQVLMFSATMPKEIKHLVNQIFDQEYKTIKMESKTNINEAIKQVAYLVRKDEKPKLLIELIKSFNNEQIIIFTRTKLETKAIYGLLKCYKFSVEALHSDRSQSSRMYALDNFRKNKSQVLVATNIAARGIDVNSLGVVINFNLPENKETYVHRIGRSGRAGKKGIAISLCTNNEVRLLKNIEKIMETKIQLISHEQWSKTFNINQSREINDVFKISRPNRQQNRSKHHSGQNSKKTGVSPFSQKNNSNKQKKYFKYNNNQAISNSRNNKYNNDKKTSKKNSRQDRNKKSKYKLK